MSWQDLASHGCGSKLKTQATTNLLSCVPTIPVWSNPFQPQPIFHQQSLMTWCKRPRRRLGTSIFFRSTSASRFNDSAASYKMSLMREKTDTDILLNHPVQKKSLATIVCARYCNNWMPRIIIRDKALGASEVVYKEKSWPDLTSLFSSLRFPASSGLYPKKELEPITRMPLFTWNVHHNKIYPSFKKNDGSKPRLPSAFCLSSSACLSFFFKAWLCTSVKQVETCQCWKVATYHMVPNNYKGVNVRESAGQPACFVGVLVIHLVIASASPIDCSFDGFLSSLPYPPALQIFTT